MAEPFGNPPPRPRRPRDGRGDPSTSGNDAGSVGGDGDAGATETPGAHEGSGGGWWSDLLGAFGIDGHGSHDDGNASNEEGTDGGSDAGDSGGGDSGGGGDGGGGGD